MVFTFEQDGVRIDFKTVTVKFLCILLYILKLRSAIHAIPSCTLSVLGQLSVFLDDILATVQKIQHNFIKHCGAFFRHN